MVINREYISLDDYEAFLAAHPDGLYELIDGEIVEKMPTQEHGVIAAKISARFLLFMEDNEIEGHVAVEARFRAKEDSRNDRLPDVSVQLSQEAPVAKGAVEGMPEIAIEIKSPTDTVADLRDKAQYYLKNGSKVVWLVYPEKHILEIYQNDADIELLTLEDEAHGGAVLPNFRVPLKKLFAIKS